VRTRAPTRHPPPILRRHERGDTVIPTLQLHNHRVGDGEPVLIVAECGINHNGQLDLALRMIEAAAGAGAGGIKFQLFRAEGMYTPRAGLYRASTGELMPIYDLMRELGLPLDWLPHLSQACRDQGVEFIMTVCDEWCVAQMDAVEFDAYKIASYEVGHLPMLAEIARRDQPIFMSSGAATMAEVREAMSVLAPDGQRPIGLLQCTAKYPAPEETLHLSVIETLAAAFPSAIPGFSDHSRDPLKAPVQAVYHGAKVIEKHFTLDRNLPGADHSFAIEPADLRELVAAVRDAEARLERGSPEPQALDPILAGHPDKHVEPIEDGLRHFATRGIFSLRDIRAGERFSAENVRVLRPGELPQGLHPRYYAGLIAGGTAARDIPAWTGLQAQDVAGVELP
jgi:N-acetylneuraminate synthase